VDGTRRWSGEGIDANATHPGAIATNLQKHTGGPQTPLEKAQDPRTGAATSMLLAASPLLEGIGGRYFDDCTEVMVLHGKPVMFSSGVAPWALDPATPSGCGSWPPGPSPPESYAA
jgi:NAD(P)-dependent dehydrogenase (short-subunit alcohol dehydrogenase family)